MANILPSLLKIFRLRLESNLCLYSKSYVVKVSDSPSVACHLSQTVGLVRTVWSRCAYLTLSIRKHLPDKVVVDISEDQPDHLVVQNILEQPLEARLAVVEFQGTEDAPPSLLFTY